MSSILIQFKNFNQEYINKILRETLNYMVEPYALRREIFNFEGWRFLHRRMAASYTTLDEEVRRFAYDISKYSYVSGVRHSYDPESDRYRIVVLGQETFDPFANSLHMPIDTSQFYSARYFGGYIEPTSPEFIRKYFENDRKAVLDAYKRDTAHLRIPKTFEVYSGYSRDGRLRTVVHWQDGVKTDVYLKPDDFDDLYLAIAYCYVKRKFGNMSHFRRIVERNTKDVTGGVKRFIYGGDSTLLVPVMLFSIYDQVALYLAISYLGDTDQWLTDEDIKRLEDSVNE